MAILCTLVEVYVLVLFGRVILSWFPITPGTFLAQVYELFHLVTEPLLGPLRRMIPPLGMIDISPLVAILLVQIVGGAIFC